MITIEMEKYGTSSCTACGESLPIVSNTKITMRSMPGGMGWVSSLCPSCVAELIEKLGGPTLNAGDGANVQPQADTQARA